VTAMTGRRCAVLLLAIAALVAGCAGGATSSRPQRPASRPAPVPDQTIAATGVVSSRPPGCTTAIQSAPALPAAATAMTTVTGAGSSFSLPADPFGVVITAGGRWAFASVGGDLGVLQLPPGRPARLIRTIAMPEPTAGLALTPDGRLLLLAGGSGAVVVSVPAAERGSGGVVLGELSATGARLAGAIEVAVSRDSRYAFVSLEDAAQVAVFDLAKALADHFLGAYVGAIPTQLAPVGLAVSPDGRWLYSTSELANRHTEVGTLNVISVPQAESNPAASVVATVPAGCNPVRVVTSADGTVIWVTARASDALLAFSAAKLRADRDHSLLADVRVGEAPVGLALARDGSLVVVADSNRFSAPGRGASLAVVSVVDALASQPALVGYLPAGQFPRDMAAGPGGSTLLVADFASGQLEIVNAAALP
jgi:DNA-binding beta-propeller fold protein YncE